MEVINVVSPGYVNEKWLHKLYLFCDSIRDKKAHNYQPANLRILDHLTFDVLVDGATIVSFCGIYRRDFYPDGVYRILNRTYTNIHYRGNGLTMPWYNSQYLVPNQLERFQDYIDVGFFSMEESKRQHNINLVPKQFGQFNNNWHKADGYVKVADCNRKPCWQLAMYRKFTLRYDGLPLDKITETEYYELPD